MQMKKFIASFIAFFVAVSFLGCGKKEEQNTAVNNMGQFSLGEEKETPKKGGTITIYSYKPDTLCPLLSKNKANLRMLGIVYDGLFSVDGNMNINPCLASGWTASENNTKYTVELKKNILFHDGMELSAQDVVFSVNTIKQNSESTYYYNVSPVKSVSAVGKYKLEFVLTKPLSRFAALLDFPVIKEQSEAIDLNNFSPVGTGGFKFENRNEGNLFHLVRNDKWWGGEVYLDSVKVKLLPDKDTAMYAFSLNELSLCPAEGPEWGKFVDAQSSDYIEYAEGSFNFLGFNNKNLNLSSEEVREAISLVLDREELLKSGNMSFSSAANFPVKREWGMTEDYALKARSLNDAKKLLEENGWSLKGGVYSKSENRKTNKLSFEILINEESYKKEQIAKKISEQLTSFGILAEVKKVSYDNYIKAINSKAYDMMIGSVELSPEMDFSFMFGEGNMFGAYDEELYTAQANLQLAQDSEDFNIKLEEFLKLFEAKNPFYGIGFESQIMLYKKNLSGALSPTKNNIYNGIEMIYLK